MTNPTNNTIVINSNETNLTIYICIHIVMPCAVAIGIIGNLLSILVFSRREMTKFCVSIFTIVLALSDILLLVTSVFNIILPGFFAGFIQDKSAFWCHFHGYFDLLFAALSGYSVVFISVERWFSVWKPFDKAKYVTFKSTICTVISYISISLLLFSWFPWTLHYDSLQSNVRDRCKLKRRTVYKIFGTLSVIYTYITPFIFLGILNILIVYRLHTRQHTSIQRSIMSTSSASGMDSSLASSSTRKRQQRQRNADRNITFMLITVAVAFMVMSFPYQIYWFYLQIKQTKRENPSIVTLTQTFRYLNCCCNFFLYSATSSLFRRELREIFQCSNSSIIISNDTNLDIKQQRARTLSSPPMNQRQSENYRSSETRQLLSTNPTVQSASTKTILENVDLTIDTSNGHPLTNS